MNPLYIPCSVLLMYLTCVSNAQSTSALHDERTDTSLESKNVTLKNRARENLRAEHHISNISSWNDSDTLTAYTTDTSGTNSSVTPTANNLGLVERVIQDSSSVFNVTNTDSNINQFESNKLPSTSSATHNTVSSTQRSKNDTERSKVTTVDANGRTVERVDNQDMHTGVLDNNAISTPPAGSTDSRVESSVTIIANETTTFQTTTKQSNTVHKQSTTPFHRKVNEPYYANKDDIKKFERKHAHHSVSFKHHLQLGIYIFIFVKSYKLLIII